jgi:putative transposase
MKKQGLTHSKFSWQAGYGAFSIGESGVEKVVAYIGGQKEHHRKMTFKDELVKFLKRYKMEYDERYLWE